MKTIGEQFREFINENTEAETINEGVEAKAQLVQIMNALDDYYKEYSDNEEALKLLDTAISALSDLSAIV